MFEESDTVAEASTPDGEDVARALRRQIDAVKAQMQAHRELMRAAGLVPPPPPADPETGES
jgi:hypothetical protein